MDQSPLVESAITSDVEQIVNVPELTAVTYELSKCESEGEASELPAKSDQADSRCNLEKVVNAYITEREDAELTDPSSTTCAIKSIQGSGNRQSIPDDNDLDIAHDIKMEQVRAIAEEIKDCMREVLATDSIEWSKSESEGSAMMDGIAITKVDHEFQEDFGLELMALGKVMEIQVVEVLQDLNAAAEIEANHQRDLDYKAEIVLLQKSNAVETKLKFGNLDSTIIDVKTKSVVNRKFMRWSWRAMKSRCR